MERQKSMNNNYKYYQDPGHGWVAVKRSELHQLNIADKISHYSYQKGDTVYLEEDCDFFIFTKALTFAGKPLPDLEEIYQENTPIRGYESYKPTNDHILIVRVA